MAMYMGVEQDRVPADDSREHLRRALLKAPPPVFSIEFLAASKDSGHHSHGMRIHPVTSDQDSVSSQCAYDIWRRWEDCLWFQEDLETEYERAAIAKRLGLFKGKGVKGLNGLYKQDFASSWDSLPSGPDPKSIAQNIHEYLPTLTRRSTIFRPSLATIAKRQSEFREFVEALFSEDMPALVQEIRASNLVTQFFGQWRRDHDKLLKHQVAQRTSVSSSVFSSYFVSSTPSRPVTPITRSCSRSPCPQYSSKASEISNETMRYSPPLRQPCRYASSVSSFDTSSIISDSETCTSMPTSTEDDYTGVDHVANVINQRPDSILEILPEEREMLSKSPEKYASSIQRRPRANTLEKKANRSRQIVGTSTKSNRSSLDGLSLPDGHGGVRESWQTTATVTDLLEGLNLSLPHPIKEQKYRASIASISTFMTTSSAQAIIPQTPTTPIPCSRSSLSSCPRISVPLSNTDFEVYSFFDEDDTSPVLDAFPRSISCFAEEPYSRPVTSVAMQQTIPGNPDSNNNFPPSPTASDDTFSILDTFPRPASSLPDELYSNAEMPVAMHQTFPRSPDSYHTTFSTTSVPPSPKMLSDTFSVLDAFPRPISFLPDESYSCAEMPIVTHQDAPGSPQSCNTVSVVPPSPTPPSSSTVTAGSSTLPPGLVKVKVMHADSAILLRIPQATQFTDFRQKVFNKFVSLEGIPLSKTFTVALDLSSTVSAENARTADPTDFQFIHEDAEWESVLSTANAKLNLCIFDIPTW